MNNANVKLSKNELALVTDASVILTKNLIIDKVYQMFGQLSDAFTQQLNENKSFLPPEAFTIHPKIYKGEQYLGLPYVMLDCPRVYSAADVFAIRCFFWWGNFFSITLHLGGRFLPPHISSLRQWMLQHTGDGWFIGVNSNAWQHHFGENNYCCIDVMGNTILEETLAAGQNFIKLAKKMPLEQWDDAVLFFTGEYRKLLQVFEY